RDPEILARRHGGVVTAILCHGLREGSSMVPACPRPPTRACRAMALPATRPGGERRARGRRPGEPPCPSEGQNLPLRARSCPIPHGISFAFPQVFGGSSPPFRTQLLPDRFDPLLRGRPRSIVSRVRRLPAAKDTGRRHPGLSLLFHEGVCHGSDG